VLYPVVIFPGSCEFKTTMPANVLKTGLLSYVDRFEQELLTEFEVSGICRKLESLLADPSLTKAAHLRSLAARYRIYDSSVKRSHG
jgi:hypothetical protein